MAGHTWNFATISGRRLELLQTPRPFAEIAAEIARTMTVLCCHSDPNDDSRFRRFVYNVEVSNDLFDQFFNSEWGYRGGYFRSPFDGLSVNHELLQAVAPSLANSSATKNCRGNKGELVEPDLQGVQNAFAGLSAKAWLAESGMEFLNDRQQACAGCTGQFTQRHAVPGEILNDRWRPGTGDENAGSSAPCLSKIKLMSAFLDDCGNELIASRKRRRALDIHSRGWS